jgi:iron(II)-dependent oxidoreductase
MKTVESLLALLDETDVRMRMLLDDLSDELLAVPYHRGINPPIWELGHSAFFYEYFLLRGLENPDARMPGYDSMWDSLEIQHRDRWRDGMVPDRKITTAYYVRILDEMRHFLVKGLLSPYQRYLTEYCIAHQNMHVESLIYARQTLAYPKPAMMTGFGNVLGEIESGVLLDDVHVPAGSYPIGLPANELGGEPFCFDNEKPGLMKEMKGFSISPTLVSCGEFLEFVEDDGYRRNDLWSFGGQHWLREGCHRQPSYWRMNHGEWYLRRFKVWQKLPLDQPMLHVSYWEAEAFCNWSARRLPSEYEWEAAARGVEGNLYPWGAQMDDSRVDMDGVKMGQCPVDGFPEGASPFGCFQMLGTAWEWTSNQYLPYDGFCVDMYAYMSTLQFGDHKTTRGGSCATSSSLIRNTYRQAYFPGRSDVYTGFRTCVI